MKKSRNPEEYARQNNKEALKVTCGHLYGTQER